MRPIYKDPSPIMYVFGPSLDESSDQCGRHTDDGVKAYIIKQASERLQHFGLSLASDDLPWTGRREGREDVLSQVSHRALSNLVRDNHPKDRDSHREASGPKRRQHFVVCCPDVEHIEIRHDPTADSLNSTLYLLAVMLGNNLTQDCPRIYLISYILARTTWTWY